MTESNKNEPEIYCECTECRCGEKIESRGKYCVCCCCCCIGECLVYDIEES